MKYPMIDAMKITLYFDDYGAKQATYIFHAMVGGAVQITIDG
jgi:hypothetical protein